MKGFIIQLLKSYKNISEFISAYQISPFFYSGCRHFPTCSEYAVMAINKHGVVKGILKSAWRVLRCNSLSHKFYDPA